MPTCGLGTRIRRNARARITPYSWSEPIRWSVFGSRSVTSFFTRREIRMLRDPVLVAEMKARVVDAAVRAQGAALAARHGQLRERHVLLEVRLRQGVGRGFVETITGVVAVEFRVS